MHACPCASYVFKGKYAWGEEWGAHRATGMNEDIAAWRVPWIVGAWSNRMRHGYGRCSLRARSASGAHRWLNGAWNKLVLWCQKSDRLKHESAPWAVRNTIKGICIISPRFSTQQKPRLLYKLIVLCTVKQSQCKLCTCRDRLCIIAVARTSFWQTISWSSQVQ